MTKEPTTSSAKKWVIAGFVCLLFLWLQAEYQVRILKSEIQQLQLCDVKINAVDKDSGEKLYLFTTWPDSTFNTRFPTQLTTFGTDSYGMQMKWIGIEPIEIGVGAEGYETQTLIFDENSDSEITIELVKVKSN